MSFYQSLENIVVGVAEMLRPAERLLVSEAAEKYRYLKNEGSYVGPWVNKKAPYLVEPMNTCQSLDYTGMIFVGPARTGKSDMFFNWLTHTAICDPADMMVIHMTNNTARDWSITDLGRNFRWSKELGARLAKGRQHDNVHDKHFTSGMRLLIKWPAISELSGKTIPRLWLMDYDRMDQDIEGEGAPFDLARKRATTFKRFGMCVAESSPGFDVDTTKWIATSPHEAPPTRGLLALYNRGDRRRWYWQCPQCRSSFQPEFKLLNFPATRDFVDAAEQAVMVCPHDGFPMGPEFKQELNEGGRWVKDGMLWLPDDRISGTPRRTDIASFWMQGPAAAFQDWSSLVLKHLQATDEWEKTGDEGALRTTVNLDQGCPYTPKSVDAERVPEELKSRAYDWGGSQEDPVVPEPVRFLIATIDVQKKSFVVQVHGIAPGGDIYLIDAFKIRHSPNRRNERDEREQIDPASYGEDWKALVEGVIEKTYPLADESGRLMQIKAVACDSGGAAGATTNAYNFWRWLRDDPDGRNYHRRFQLVKGEPSKSAPRIRIGFPDSQRKDRHAGSRGDVPVMFIHSDQMKDAASAVLGRAESGELAMPGFGMIHFPKWLPDYIYTQLTAEVRLAKGWDAKGKRNEAWDLLYYCLAVCLNGRQISPSIERFDWTDPPGWAADWEINDLVLDPRNNKQLDNQQTDGMDLESLGSDLA
jgi:phage terminase large subunit GpA-like protein